MADNVTVSVFGGGSAIMATDDIGGVHLERVKLVLGADGANDGDVSSANPVPTKETGVAAATVTSVSDTATSTTLLASNAARRGAAFYNDSAQPLNLKFGATASASSFTKRLAANEFWAMPAPIYTGVIDGIWDADGSGACRITEW